MDINKNNYVNLMKSYLKIHNNSFPWKKFAKKLLICEWIDKDIIDYFGLQNLKKLKPRQALCAILGSNCAICFNLANCLSICYDIFGATDQDLEQILQYNYNIGNYDKNILNGIDLSKNTDYWFLWSVKYLSDDILSLDPFLQYINDINYKIINKCMIHLKRGIKYIWIAYYRHIDINLHFNALYKKNLRYYKMCRILSSNRQKFDNDIWCKLNNCKYDCFIFAIENKIVEINERLIIIATMRMIDSNKCLNYIIKCLGNNNEYSKLINTLKVLSKYYKYINEISKHHFLSLVDIVKYIWKNRSRFCVLDLLWDTTKDLQLNELMLIHCVTIEDKINYVQLFQIRRTHLYKIIVKKIIKEYIINDLVEIILDYFSPLHYACINNNQCCICFNSYSKYYAYGHTRNMCINCEEAKTCIFAVK